MPSASDDVYNQKWAGCVSSGYENVVLLLQAGFQLLSPPASNVSSTENQFPVMKNYSCPHLGEIQPTAVQVSDAFIPNQGARDNRFDWEITKVHI